MKYEDNWKMQFMKWMLGDINAKIPKVERNIKEDLERFWSDFAIERNRQLKEFLANT
ncbi:hypothetical protein NUSPORA_01406 [Nucleospora cyclopteri]